MKQKGQSKPSTDGNWWQALDRRATSQEYPPGVALLSQAAPAREVFIIRRGLVKLVWLDEGGQEVLMGLRGASWVLGGAAATLAEPATFSTVTLTACELQRLAAADFLSLLATEAAFAAHWQRLLCRENLAQMQRTVELRCRPARLRLEQLLWELVCLSGEGEPLQLPMKFWELADLIAVTPEYLSRLLARLERDGLLRRDDGQIVIPSADLLWRGQHLNNSATKRLRQGVPENFFEGLLI
ncbi:MAG: Crp/Fnr family transcriptional regulator [Acidobacteriota bacterium]|nr:Crp/Fnr family transcriptional regulator [Acidobacteriota bacterium]